jgi:hypothetical protein
MLEEELSDWRRTRSPLTELLILSRRIFALHEGWGGTFDELVQGWLRNVGLPCDSDDGSVAKTKEDIGVESYRDIAFGVTLFIGLLGVFG